MKHDHAKNLSRRTFLGTLALSLPALGVPAHWAEAAAGRRTSLDDLRFIGTHLPLHRRHEWARIAPNPQRLREAQPNRYNRITVHHAGTGVIRVTSIPEVVRCLDGMLGAHLQRNFGDVGYHFLLDYAGRVWEGRPLAYWGAHVSGHNEGNIGIVLLGNFERQRPSKAQLKSLEQLIPLLQKQYAIHRKELYGHIDLGQTLCPGKYLYPQVGRMKQLA